MEINCTEWQEICRICLQEGELFSVFDFDNENSELNIADKVMQCSSIEISPDGKLPEQICSACLMELDVAFRFRKKCEESDLILQSYIESNVEPIESVDAVETVETVEFDSADDQAEDSNEANVDDGKVVISSLPGFYEYKPPEGLNFRRTTSAKRAAAQKKPMVQSKITSHTIFLKSEPLNEDLSMDDTEYEEVYETEIGYDDVEGGDIDSHTKLIVSDAQAMKSTIETDTDESKSTQIKPVRTNKVRLGYTSANKRKALSTTNVTTKSKAAVNSKGNMTATHANKAKASNAKEPKQPKKCEICGNTYMYQHALESHMRRHRNEKPFVCSVCGKGFVINFELSRHMRTHTGQKPYACKFCDRRFSDFGSRVKHERIHTGERPYACDICGKTFAYSHVLSSHNLIHTGEKKYHCEICGKRFAKSHHLKAHLNTHNKDNSAKNQLSRVGSQQLNRTELLQEDIIEGTEQMYAHLDETSQIDDENVNEDDYVDFLNDSSIIAKVSTSGTEDDGSESEQLLLYDVDVMNAIKDSKFKRAIETKGAQIITIDEQDAMDLLEFEDELE